MTQVRPTAPTAPSAPDAPQEAEALPEVKGLRGRQFEAIAAETGELAGFRTVVKKDDNLTHIARELGIQPGTEQWKTFLAANAASLAGPDGKFNPNVIQPGAVIHVPAELVSPQVMEHGQNASILDKAGVIIPAVLAGGAIAAGVVAARKALGMGGSELSAEQSAQAHAAAASQSTVGGAPNTVKAAAYYMANRGLVLGGGKVRADLAAAKAAKATAAAATRAEKIAAATALRAERVAMLRAGANTAVLTTTELAGKAVTQGKALAGGAVTAGSGLVARAGAALTPYYLRADAGMQAAIKAAGKFKETGSLAKARATFTSSLNTRLGWLANGNPTKTLATKVSESVAKRAAPAMAAGAHAATTATTAAKGAAGTLMGKATEMAGKVAGAFKANEVVVKVAESGAKAVELAKGSALPGAAAKSVGFFGRLGARFASAIPFFGSAVGVGVTVMEHKEAKRIYADPNASTFKKALASVTTGFAAASVIPGIGIIAAAGGIGASLLRDAVN